MVLNDKLGICTWAAGVHLIQGFTANSDRGEIILPDEAAVQAYSQVGGYDPNAKLDADGQNPTDGGCIVLDVLKYWRRTGIGGHKIAGFVTVNAQNLAHVQAACEFFGGTYSGVGLPITAQTQDLWDVPAAGLSGEGAPYSWGGHCIWVPAYDACITWGQRKQFTPAFASAYIDERHAIVTMDFINQVTAASPDGLKFQQLQDDIQQIKDAA